ncbi:MAG: sensor histidine kinase [Herpetosiphonaceae bacterium]|nr:sensor histidine kinase [Herpetosiphonaceae bacterium]
MRRWPLVYQILLVNTSIVFLGATAGTQITLALASSSSLVLTIGFAFLGLLLSIAANYFLLRFALRPLIVLQTVAELVAAGDLNVRAASLAEGEPALARLANTFNTMLDRLAEDTHAIEQSQILTERLTQQVISAQEDERRRIARELHDETAQSLATLVIYADALNTGEDEQAPSLLRQGIERIRNIAEQTLFGVRDIIADLRPSLLDDLGLDAAIRWQVQERLEPAGIRADVQVRGAGRRLSPAIETALYRVVQEVVSNVIKHAGASYVEIDLDLSRREVVTARLEDNGRGFDAGQLQFPPQPGMGVGLFGMQERINLFEGTLQIDSSPGEGTEIRLSIPINEPARLPSAEVGVLASTPAR